MPRTAGRSDFVTGARALARSVFCTQHGPFSWHIFPLGPLRGPPEGVWQGLQHLATIIQPDVWTDMAYVPGGKPGAHFVMHMFMVLCVSL